MTATVATLPAAPQPIGMGSAQLRRVRWAVRATLVIGVAASVAANVLHARHNPIAQAIAAWPPLALLLTVELVSRVPVHRRSLAAVRIVATILIASIAAYVSYWHMAAVAARYGEIGLAPYLLPLSVDGLVIVASVCLVELAGRLREHAATVTQPAHEPVVAVPIGVARVDVERVEVATTPSADLLDQAVVRELAAAGEPRHVHNADDTEPEDTEPDADEPTVEGSTATVDTAGEIANEGEAASPSVLPDDLAAALPAARVAQEELRRQGRSLTRRALMAQMRRAGHSISTERAQALLTVLRHTPPGSANGHRTHPR